MMQLERMTKDNSLLFVSNSGPLTAVVDGFRIKKNLNSANCSPENHHALDSRVNLVDILIVPPLSLLHIHKFFKDIYIISSTRSLV